MNINVNFIPLADMLRYRGLETSGKVQQFVDSEVLRLSDPYVPFLSGDLKLSGPLATTLGSGLVQYNMSYARKNYYFNRGKGKQGTASGGLRGKMWFERMKADHLREILAGAKKIAGGS